MSFSSVTYSRKRSYVLLTGNTLQPSNSCGNTMMANADSASSLFDDMMASSKSSKRQVTPLKRTTRAKRKSPKSDDPFNFSVDDATPPKLKHCATFPPARKTAAVKRNIGFGGIEPSDDEDDCDELASCSQESEVSLTTKVDLCSLDSPTKSIASEKESGRASRRCDVYDDISDVEVNTWSVTQPKYAPLKRKTAPDPSLDAQTEVTPTPPAMEDTSSISTIKKLYSGENKKISLKAVYKHQWNREENGEAETTSSTSSVSQRSNATGKSDSKQRLTSSSMVLQKRVIPAASKYDNEVVSVRCSKEAKQIYKVVRNVRDASQCREWGEAQDISDEIRYLLGSICPRERNKDTANSVQVRLLSLTKLANHCLDPTFRAHMRAHNFVAHVMYALQDADKFPVLAIWTAIVLYLLCRDVAGIVLDPKIMTLVVKLLKFSPTDNTAVDYRSQLQKAFQVLLRWKESVSTDDQKTVFDLTQENISPGLLALESVVFLSIRKVGNVVLKQGLRCLSGLDFLVDEMEKWSNRLDGENKVESLQMLRRYISIFQYVCLMHKQNQNHLITYNNAKLLEVSGKIFSKCLGMLKTNEDTAVIAGAEQGFVGVVKMLMNLSNESELCCMRVGELPNFLKNSLQFVALGPTVINLDFLFEYKTLVLALLINLLEHSHSNRKRLMDPALKVEVSDCKDERFAALEALTKVYTKHEIAVQGHEKDLGIEKIVEKTSTATAGTSTTEPKTGGTDDEKPLSQKEINAFVDNAVVTAGLHLENSVIACYSIILIGFMLQVNEEMVAVVQSYLTDGKLDPMVTRLTEFAEFMKKTEAISSNALKSIDLVIEILEKLC